MNFNLTPKGVRAFGAISAKINTIKSVYHPNQVFDRVVFECSRYPQCIIDYSFGVKTPNVLQAMVSEGYAS